MRFGAHLSTAKGYVAMADYAAEVGCECIQVFAKSPRQWSAKPLAPERAGEMRDLVASGRIEAVNTHTSYLINLSTEDDGLRAKSTDALADELVRAALLGAPLVNTHVGAAACLSPKHAPDADGVAVEGALAEAAGRVSDAIKRAYELAEASLGADAKLPTLLLEDTAGAGHVYGASIAELAAVTERCGFGPERLGICIDTCHAWAAGYDLSDEAGWNALLRRIDDLMGLSRLQLLHVNDCLHDCGEHKDRHAWIGRGEIGIEGFAAMVRDERLAGLPSVCEMPGELPVKDALNLEVLKDLRDGVEPREALARAEARHPGAKQT